METIVELLAAQSASISAQFAAQSESISAQFAVKFAEFEDTLTQKYGLKERPAPMSMSAAAIANPQEMADSPLVADNNPMTPFPSASESGNDEDDDFESSPINIKFRRRRDTMIINAGLPETPMIGRTRSLKLATDSVSNTAGDLRTLGQTNFADPGGKDDIKSKSPSISNSRSKKLPGGSIEDKRSTLLERQVLALANSEDQRISTVIKQEPPHNIQLRTLTLSAIIRFVDDVLEYQYRHQINLRVGTLIASDIAQELCCRYDDLTVVKLLNFPTSDIFHILQLEIAPQTSYEFYNRLNLTVRFELNASNSYRPSAHDFRPFYTALLKYRRSFIRAYDILVRFVTKDVVPPFNNKQYGLIRLFLEKIPFDYGNRIQQAHIQHCMNKSEINNIYQYMGKFFDVIEQHFEVYRLVRQMQQHFGGSHFHGGDNASTMRRGHISSTSSTHRLHSIPNNNNMIDQTVIDEAMSMVLLDPILLPESEDSLDDGNAYSPTAQVDPILVDPHISFADLQEPAPQSVDIVDDNDNLVIEEEDNPHQLNNMGHNYSQQRQVTPSPSAGKVLVCRATLTSSNGKCPLLAAGRSCKYSHDSVHLQAAAKQLMAQLANSPLLHKTHDTHTSKLTFPPRVQQGTFDRHNSDNRSSGTQPTFLRRSPVPPPSNK